MADVWAVYIARGTHRYVGRKSGRFYGRIGGGMLVRLDQQDVEADQKNWRIVSDQEGAAAVLGQKVLARRQVIGSQAEIQMPDMPRIALPRDQILARAQAAWMQAHTEKEKPKNK